MNNEWVKEYEIFIVFSRAGGQIHVSTEII